MRTASFKHVLRADLRPGVKRPVVTALLALALVPALCDSRALASATGGAAAASTSGTPSAGSQPTVETTATGGVSAASTQLARRALATWFGPGFYGSTTACGQKMTTKLLGVASRTLPCGTLVQISYQGREVTVPVVDRGPYGHIGARWDLTAGTARALNVEETVHVMTEIVGSVPNTPTLGAPVEAQSLQSPPTTESAPAATAASTGGAAAR